MTQKILIGLECHIQLNTRTKLFCSCPAQGTPEPNTRTCPVCLGHPGSKPVLNKKAVEHALKLCLAVGSKISPELIFSRKSYFYPDMAKNYQISQYEMPLGTGGSLKLSKDKVVKLTRIHMEEDPAALVHPAAMGQSAYVLVDYNRSGNPLVEVVTEPDMHSAEEARLFMKKLITILSYLEIFDINTCIIKADVNVNVLPYPRVEIKNVTGFKEIQRAIEHELSRQQKELAEGKKGVQHTRSWDAEKSITEMLRSKETEEEYGYIIDPDLVVTEITAGWLKQLRAQLPELAEAKLEKFMEEHKITEEDARIISAEKEMAELFERVAKEINPVLAAKWLRRELNRVLNYNKKALKDIQLDEKNLITLLKLVEAKKITDATAKKLLEELVVRPFDIEAFVKKEGLAAVSDVSQLEKFCKEAIKESPDAVKDFKAGSGKALNFIVGKVMQKTKGKASPGEVHGILKRLLK